MPRIHLLVLVQLLLGVLPLARMLVPLDVTTLPLLWALFVIPLGQLMLVGLWLAMGRSALRPRFLAAVAACAYLAIWTSIPSDSYALMLIEYLAVTVGIAVACIPFRRWYELRLQAAIAWDGTSTRLQFSILGILLATSVAALVLGISKAARTQGSIVTQMGLMVVVLAINTLVAAWASLSLGRVRWPLTLAFVIAILLGAVTAIGNGIQSAFWGLWVGMALVMVLPTAVVVASLMVVRSCGYRLVRRDGAEMIGAINS